MANKNGTRPKPAAFSFFPHDWLSSPKIMLMTPAEEGAYIRLLCIAWDDPTCSLPDDDDQLARLSRLGADWQNGSGKVLRDCFESHPKLPFRLVNKKLFFLKQKNLLWRKKCSDGGVSSGNSRRNNGKGTSTKDEVKGNSYPPTLLTKNISEVFEFWRAETGRVKAKLTTDRRTKIAARLKEGYTVDEIKRAIDGCRASPFHRGENPTGKVWDDIELICRTGAKLEGFLNSAPAPKAARPQPVADDDEPGITYAEFKRKQQQQSAG